MVFERVIDLPREIVWDALTDDVLVSGWLAEAQIEPRQGGRYDLEWMHPDPFPATLGTIRDFDAPSRLTVETSNLGVLSFDLAHVDGGSRGSSTALTLTIGLDIESVFSRPLRAYWLTDLDQLERLLHGHPVDWSTWQRDHGEAWRAHLAAISTGIA